MKVATYGKLLLDLPSGGPVGGDSNVPPIPAAVPADVPKHKE